MITDAYVKLVCDNCGDEEEIQLTATARGGYDCRYHRFIKEWREIASGEAEDGTHGALIRADKHAASWLGKRGVK